MKNYLKYFALLLMLSVSFTGCVEKREEAQKMLSQQAEKDRHEATTFAMDTIMTFLVYAENGEQIITDAEQEIRRLERSLSVTLENSEIYTLNHAKANEDISLSSDAWDLLHRGKELGELTNGNFNITISPLVKAWGFTTDTEKHVPDTKTLETIFPLIHLENLVLNEEAQTASLAVEGMAVDLGGIAKGYTSDRVTALLRENGVTSALVNLGGNISAIGAKQDGTPWQVAVENPSDSSDYVGILSVTDASVITSGGYQRNFEENGVLYHHILDGKTGYPAENGLLSVTIISEDGTKADALSTAIFVMGLQEGLALWKTSTDFEVIFVTTDGKVVATEGADEMFAFEGRDNNFVYEVIKR